MAIVWKDSPVRSSSFTWMKNSNQTNARPATSTIWLIWGAITNSAHTESSFLANRLLLNAENRRPLLAEAIIPVRRLPAPLPKV